MPSSRPSACAHCRRLLVRGRRGWGSPSRRMAAASRSARWPRDRPPPERLRAAARAATRPRVMNTSVNSETWMSVGSSTPTMAKPFRGWRGQTLAAVAAMSSSMPCSAVRAAASTAQTMRAIQTATPYQYGLSRKAQRDGGHHQRQRHPAMRQEIAAVVQPGNLGQIMGGTEDDVGQQHQLERQKISQADGSQHQSKMSGIGAAHCSRSHALRRLPSVSSLALFARAAARAPAAS